MTMPVKHYTSKQIFMYLRGGASETEAAELERHLAGCDRCVARARREYQDAIEPPWWAPRTPVAPQPVVVPAPLPKQTINFWFPMAPALAGAAILIFFLYTPAVPPAEPVIASLMDAGGRQVRLTRSGRVTLPDGKSPPPELAGGVKDLLTKAVVAQPATVQLALAATHTDRLERGVSGDAAEDPVLLAPFATAIRETRPTFTWRPVDGAAPYTLYIVDRNRKLVWRGSAGTGTSLTLPAAAPALVRGELYRWQVEATVQGAARLSDWDSFVVLDEPGLAAVTAAEQTYGGSALLLGSLYEAHGLYSEAEAQFRRLAELNPSSPLPARMLASLRQLRKAS